MEGVGQGHERRRFVVEGWWGVWKVVGRGRETSLLGVVRHWWWDGFKDESGGVGGELGNVSDFAWPRWILIVEG